MGKKSILIVEDDLDIRELLQEYLQSDGYPVEVARNGEEALAHLPRILGNLGLILLDRNMEVMDGKAFLDRYLVDPLYGPHRVPVVMMSAAGEMDETRAVAFVNKPFNFEELIRVVGRFSL